MLTIAGKQSSNGLHNLAKALFIWSFKDVKAIRRCTYHKVQKPNSLLSKNLLLKCRRKLNFKFLSYAAESTFKSNQVISSLDNVQEFIKKHNVNVVGKDCPSPILSIDCAQFPNYIVDVLREKDIVAPTPIQAATWPIALQGRDLVGISQTGSGKTLGFAIPAILHVQNKKSEKGTSVLILSPTRELAMQTYEVLTSFKGPKSNFKVAVLYGGASRENQVRSVRRGMDICVATPGRCLDLLRERVFSLEKCSFLVLDEADRMLDMGFYPQIEEIISQIECEKQCLMWSATWPKDVQQIARKFLSNFILLSIGSMDLKPNPNVKQFVEVLDDGSKEKRLEEILLQKKDIKSLVFAQTKVSVQVLERHLRSRGFRVVSIHGDKSQLQRENALRAFRRGITQVMIATSVAARGLDIDNIGCVINYDCPLDEEDYVHKIGRTARHDKTGESITFLTKTDTYCGYLIKILAESGSSIPPELYELQRNSVIQERLKFSQRPQKKWGSFSRPRNKSQVWRI